MSILIDLPGLSAAIAAQLELVSDLIDPYLDLQAEQHGEVARYGDSWPGAKAQINGASDFRVG